ncbi:MAG: hypothetical protein K8S99_07735 [Planctomycetes bacterium]|nr:hypothetical protein [Planctomycetota bacterium]
MFITAHGRPWHQEKLVGEAGSRQLPRTDSLGLIFRRLVKATNVKVPELGFGHLRHTHRTAADTATDANVSAVILGHEIAGGR